MLCRRGKITRDEVGAIRIFDKETKVEIDADVAERFYQLAKAVDRDKIVIEPVTGEEERRPAKPFAEKASHAPSSHRRDEAPAPARTYERSPDEKKPFDKKPYEGKKKPYERKGSLSARPNPTIRCAATGSNWPIRSFRRGRGRDPTPPSPAAARPDEGGRKPYEGGKKPFTGKAYSAKGPASTGERPAGKPFKGKKPRRDDRG